jgi:large subunit ribosomal protein L5
MKSRLHERYTKEVIPALAKRFGHENSMAVPRLRKVTINIGMGEASANPKLLDTAAAELGQIAGQKPVITRAKKSIANFKIREEQPIGVKVTLRGDRAWEFFDRLLSLAIPRIRDFRGLSPKSFDGHGNYTFGVNDQLIFPEVDYDKIDAPRGFDITIVTTAQNDEQGRAFLRAYGFPFKQENR